LEHQFLGISQDRRNVAPLRLRLEKRHLIGLQAIL
jgi:hypothetical protein